MNNLVYFGGNSGWVYDCDSFLVIFTGWVVIMIVFWAEGDKGSAVVIYKIT